MDNDFEQKFLTSVKVNNEQNQLPSLEKPVKDEKPHKPKASFIYTILGIIIVGLVVTVVLMGMKLRQYSEEISYYNTMYDNVATDEYRFDGSEEHEEIKMVLSCVDKAEKQYGFYSDSTYVIADLMTSMEIESGVYNTDWSTTISIKPQENDARTIQIIDDKIVDGNLTLECKKNENV